MGPHYLIAYINDCEVICQDCYGHLEGPGEQGDWRPIYDCEWGYSEDDALYGFACSWCQEYIIEPEGENNND